MCRLREELAKGINLEDIEITFKLTELKPLHANWLIKCYNSLTCEDNQRVILAGWKESGILNAVSEGSEKFIVDPFEDIDPYATSDSNMDNFIHDTVVVASSEYINEEKIIDSGSDNSDSEFDQ